MTLWPRRLWALTLTVAGCATTAPIPPEAPTMASAPLAITHGAVEPKTLDVDAGETATIRYDLTQSAIVTSDLVDEAGRVVRHLTGGRQAAGTHTMAWEGTDGYGHAVPPGVYRYILHAHSMDAGLSTTDSTYDPSATSGGEELQPWDFTFDRQSGTFRWVMPQAGYARLRIGIEGFPHLRTLLDWQPLEAGEHTVVWDGLDETGLIALKDHPHCAITLHAFALPWNTLIVSDAGVHRPPSTDPSDTVDRGSSTVDASSPPLARPDAAYLHGRHPRALCHEPRLHLVFPTQTRSDATGRPILTGTVPVRVVLDERDAPQLVNSRFEIALFEDTTFLHEEEDGTNPFTYLWDTTRVSAGEHLLTVNVLSYDDHYGVATQPVVIEPAS